MAYLDYNATAPLRPEALSAMCASLATFGNAASQHAFGRAALSAVETARQQIATLIGCSPGELVFTSGATESNNLALSLAGASSAGIVTTAVEHPAVLEAASAATRGYPERFAVAGVRTDGVLDHDLLAAAIERVAPRLVSVMAANNETGVLTDLPAICSVAHTAGALVHSDATQLVGRGPIDLAKLDLDLMSLSAHKFGGPQGVGVLFIRRGLALSTRRLTYGGGQERGWRPGTHNVAGIAGAGAAAAAALAAMPEEARRIGKLRDTLEVGLLAAVPDAKLNGRPDQRLPGTASVTFPGTPADAIMAAMPDVAVSDGSACSSGAPGPSHVLLAMGLSPAEAECTVRFSLGHASTIKDVELAVEATGRAVEAVRSALVR